MSTMLKGKKKSKKVSTDLHRTYLGKRTKIKYCIKRDSKNPFENPFFGSLLDTLH